MTDKMADDVLKLYPDLKKAVLRRQVYARFSTLNQMCKTTRWNNEKKRSYCVYKEELKSNTF